MLEFKDVHDIHGCYSYHVPSALVFGAQIQRRRTIHDC
jgi:hypothetical protein